MKTDTIVKIDNCAIDLDEVSMIGPVSPGYPESDPLEYWDNEDDSINSYYFNLNLKGSDKLIKFSKPCNDSDRDCVKIKVEEAWRKIYNVWSEKKFVLDLNI